MKRWLFNLAAAVSLGLCSVVLLLWALCIFGRTVGLRHEHHSDPTVQPYHFESRLLYSYEGAIQYEHQIGNLDPVAYAPPLGFSWETDKAPPSFGVLGKYPFTVQVFPGWFGGHQAYRVRHVEVQDWFLVLVFALMPCVWIVRRKRLLGMRRIRMGLCPKCGYDLRASPHRCPECGAVRAKTDG